MNTPTVLFVCVRNPGRSQMAAALLERIAGDRVTGLSAGTRPAEEVHPKVVEAMRDVGIDLSRSRPRRLADETEREADVVVCSRRGSTRSLRSCSRTDRRGVSRRSRRMSRSPRTARA
jgi:arsenate reductase (thioredoxin)